MRPVVRLFVACWNGKPGTPPSQHTLADVVKAVRPKAGDVYPLLHPELGFYAMLTGGRGVHEFRIRHRVGVGPAARVVWDSPPVRLDLGADPLAVRGLEMRVKGVAFANPGQYEFVLIYDGTELEPPFFLEARA